MKFDFHKFLTIVGQLGPVVLLAVPGGAAIAPLVASNPSANAARPIL